MSNGKETSKLNLWIMRALLALVITFGGYGYLDVRADIKEKANKETVEVQISSLNDKVDDIKKSQDKMHDKIEKQDDKLDEIKDLIRSIR